MNDNIYTALAAAQIEMGSIVKGVDVAPKM
jgi:hypothetical protein